MVDEYHAIWRLHCFTVEEIQGMRKFFYHKALSQFIADILQSNVNYE